MKKIILASVLLLSISCFCNAQSKGQMGRRIKLESIPKDLSKYTLLVKIPYNTNHWVNKISDCMQNHYTAGSFEVVPYKTNIMEAPYNDTSKYKYVLLIGNSLSKAEFSGLRPRTFNNPNGVGPSNIVISALYMLDRSTDVVTYTGLDAQDIMKIIAYYDERMSGKEGE
jgi:hypothetical protein